MPRYRSTLLPLFAAIVLGSAVLAVSATSNAASGVLRVACDFDHRAPNDPIVFPGRPGASHIHNFFGNTSTDAGSTPASLQANRSTNCKLAEDTSGYWFPEMISPSGQPHPLRQAVAYYSAKPGSGYVHTMPAGAELIGGDAHAAGTQGLDAVKWDCLAHPEVAPSATPVDCTGHGEAQVTIRFPNCWNQQDPSNRLNFVYGFKGNICPQGYVAIPHLRVSFETGLADPRGYTLRSGPLYTAHADFMNGWQQADLDAQLRNAGVIQ